MKKLLDLVYASKVAATARRLKEVISRAARRAVGVDPLEVRCPPGTRLVAFTASGRDRYPPTMDGYENAQAAMKSRTRDGKMAKPVAVFRTVYSGPGARRVGSQA